ncbi:MAG: hypothetical protein ACK40G_14825 [Cytophagaceae bacterium]
MKKVCLLYLLFFVFIQVTNAQQTPFGVNLSGAEFGSVFPGTYNSHYTYPTVAELDYFKSKGLTLIRLPFK